MSATLGPLETQLLAYAQGRNRPSVSGGGVRRRLWLDTGPGAAGLKPPGRQGADRAGPPGSVPRAAAASPGRSLEPGRVPGPRHPDGDRGGRYQISGPNTFYRYGWTDQVPEPPLRLQQPDLRRPAGRRGCADADQGRRRPPRRARRSCAPRKGSMPSTPRRPGRWSTRSTTGRGSTPCPKHSTGFAGRSKRDEAFAAEFIRTTIEYGNQGTMRRIGALLETDGRPGAAAPTAERRTHASSSFIPWIPNRRQTGKDERAMGGGLQRWVTSREADWYHEDLRRFRDALTFTEAESGFNARLIEKDYYCSLVLHDLAALFGQGLVFKGGTCLSKVHAEFFRLSEDLDFCDLASGRMPPGPNGDGQSTPIRDHLAEVPSRLACFELAEAIEGHNDSRQYNGRLAYRSVVTGERELHQGGGVAARRESSCRPRSSRRGPCCAIPTPASRRFLPSTSSAVQLHEAYAEKIRAALTRREPAIRDFFDIDHAVRRPSSTTGTDRYSISSRQSCR